MCKLYLVLLLLSACSDQDPPHFEGKQQPAESPDPEESMNPVETSMGSKSVEDSDQKTAGTTPPPELKPVPPPAPIPEFVVDPDTLSFPVVFHVGNSTAWQTEEKLRPVIAEAQRILLQAKIEILPTYSKDAAATEFLDVTYVQQVPNEPGINGISYGGQPLEVYVIDNVGLNKVDDKRPTEAMLPRYFKGAKPGDKIPVSANEAEQGRTTAHEIGHQLGLPHRQDMTNLLASGTTGWTLNPAEIATVRSIAVSKFKAKFVKSLNP